ncbi:uncharacterized protein LOC119435708 [Dermacentor silvarum]|uniref:uncharacterized protein LOC119435708 n=1 Tax=Dermacentor silvarum TaxID=543639 RepID=UPI0021017B54|nr:uncharacterized protein LOC119435708 [Dermacentor silvarum]
MDQARSTCNGGTSQPPKRRKRYLEPGETYSLPRTSLRYQERVQDSQSSLQTPQQQSLRSSGAGSANAGVCNNYLSCEISDNDDFDASDQNLYHAESDEGDSNKQYDSESSSAEDCSGAEECEGDGDEFCRLFSSECLPNSDMSVRDAMLTLMAYTASVGLNWTDMEKLVGVINLFLGKPVLPTSSYMLRKVWKQWMGGLVERHYFCEACEAVIPNPRQKDFSCPHCNTTNSGQNFFVTLDLKKQIEIMLIDKSVSKGLMESLKKRQLQSDEGTVKDISDGRLYKEQMKNSSWCDISLTFNTDGAKVFKCNKASIWPIQCVVNELPLSLRWSNVLLCGLYFGKGHPRMSQFLGTFVKSLKQLNSVKWKCDEQALSSKVHITCCCVDAPARAAVLNMKQYNGYFGCSFCLHRGVHIRGKYFQLQASLWPFKHLFVPIYIKQHSLS